MKSISLAAGFFLLATPALAVPQWKAEMAPNTIDWSGVEGQGDAFAGYCSNFIADIAFDPADLAASAVKVTIDMASCRTGDVKEDRYLPLEGWFDVKGYPKAVFEAKRFRHVGGRKYVADGTLTLKGVTKPVALPFTLDIDGNKARVVGMTVLNRLDFGVGSGQLAASSVAAPSVKVDINLRATRE